MITTKTYSGAGVLIVIKLYNEKKKKYCVYVLVGKNKKNMCNDFGGTYELKHDKLETTASTELREESRNLFNINADKIKECIYIDIEHGEKYYRTYILFIENRDFKVDYYYRNKKILNESENVPKYWKETEDITLIKIKTITKNDKIKDICGNDVNMQGRLKNIIKTVINNGIMNMIIKARKKIDYMNTKLEENKESEHEWLNGTVSIII